MFHDALTPLMEQLLYFHDYCIVVLILVTILTIYTIYMNLVGGHINRFNLERQALEFY